MRASFLALYTDRWHRLYAHAPVLTWEVVAGPGTEVPFYDDFRRYQLLWGRTKATTSGEVTYEPLIH